VKAASARIESRPAWGPRLAYRSIAAPPRRDSCRVLALLELAEPSRSDERALCESARSGSREALGQLLERHGPRLYRSILLPRLGSVDAAEEALSITYTKVIERFAQFEWQDVGVYPWLRMVALRVAIDMLRARKREVLFEPSDLEREMDPNDLFSAEELEERDLAAARQRVVELLVRIHPRYSDAIRLRVLESRSREEAAQELGVTVATFDVVLHRALASLKKVLSHSEEGA